MNPDTEHALAFVRVVVPQDANELFIATRPKGGFLRQRPVPDSQVLAEAAVRDRENGDVYLATASFAKGRQRTKDRVRDKWVITADVDDKAMPGETPEERHRNAFRVADSVPAPCVIVDTGGGFHVHVPLPPDYRLSSFKDRGTGLRATEILERALLYYLEEQAARLLYGLAVELDRAVGSERLWRVPYTLNHKYDPPRPVTIARFGHAAPTPGSLPAWPGPGSMEFLVGKAEQAKRDHDHAALHSSDVDLDGLDDLPDFDTAILPAHLITQWPMDGDRVDQSAADYRVVCSLVERGYVDDGLLASAIVHRRLELSDHGDRQKAKRREYVISTIRRAKAHVTESIAFSWSDEEPDAPRDGLGAKPAEAAVVGWEGWDYQELMPHLRGPYQAVLPEGHFVTDYVRMVADRTDAPYAYSEALAFTLLAAATPNVEVRLRYLAGALATNLYTLLLGESGVSRKSTSLDHARRILTLQEVVANAEYAGFVAARTTPERLIERLARVRRDSAVWHLDELQALISDTRRSYMTAIRGLILELYSRRNYDYERASKRNDAGDVIEDVSRIRGCYLSIMTAATNAIYADLFKRDVQDGFLPRFVIVSDRNSMRPRGRHVDHDVSDMDEARVKDLAVRWAEIYRWSTDFDWSAVEAGPPSPRARLTPGAMSILDRFGNWVEHQAFNEPDAMARTMVNRAMDTATKLSVLVRVGHRDGVLSPAITPGGKPEPANVLLVTEEDAHFGCEFAGRWCRNAMSFGEGFHETAHNANLAFVREVVKDNPGVSLTPLRKKLQKLPRHTQDELIAQLIEQGDMHRVKKMGQGRPSFVFYPGPAKEA